LYGPHGVGALYVKPGVRIQSIILGGGQERGLRSGTENVYSIAVWVKQQKLWKMRWKTKVLDLQKIRDKLISEITKIDETYLTGHPTSDYQIMQVLDSVILRVKAFF